MLNIKYTLNKKQYNFQATLPYTMIGVCEGNLITLFQNYKEVDKFGNKYKKSFNLIPCQFSGKPIYKTNYFLEKFDENRSEFIWNTPIEPVKEETKILSNGPTKKLKKKKAKK